MRIDFGEWTPDLPPLLNKNLVTLVNCLPFADGYGSFQSPVVYSIDGLDARCQGAFAVTNYQNSSFTFAGDKTKLYRLESRAFVDVTRQTEDIPPEDDPYDTPDDGRWVHTQFGNLLIVTNYADDIQKINLSSGSNFEKLSETAPRARYITTIRDFVVLGNIYDSGKGGENPYRVQWSPIGAPEGDWTQSQETQADFQDLNGINGHVTGVFGGEYGVVFQKTGISRMTYVGSPIIFQFDLVDRQNGTSFPGSIVPFNSMWAFISQNGFSIFDGNSTTNVGENKVNRFFFDDFDGVNYDRVVGFIIPQTTIIGWIYPDHNATDNTPNKMILFNYAPDVNNRWGLIAGVNSDMTFVSLTEDVLLRELDDWITMGTTKLKDIPYPLNSSVFKGGGRVLSSFSTNNTTPNVMFNFSGDALPAKLETHDYQLTDSRLTDISLMRPVTSGNPALTLSIGERNKLSDEVRYPKNYTINSTGDFPVLSSARFQRFVLSTIGEFKKLQGFEIIDMTAGGFR